MVEAELLSTLQSISYIAGATGVCIAAFYYVQILRNAEREKRRQTLLMRMPAMSKEYMDSYWYLRTLKDWKTRQEFIQKHASNPEVLSKLHYVMNIYNILGMLYIEGLMKIEDIAQLYPPASIIGMFERFWFYVPINRKSSLGEDADPKFWFPLESLYKDLKGRFPGIEGTTSSVVEQRERERLREINIFSKIQPP
ncbi:hypothetical protein FJY84_02705 [Candidatus Bathyarchaeota archaeon]|nr:hypothetical protein [Candidatus Bathyarchaeota archaeon]